MAAAVQRLGRLSSHIGSTVAHAVAAPAADSTENWLVAERKAALALNHQTHAAARMATALMMKVLLSWACRLSAV